MEYSRPNIGLGLARYEVKLGGRVMYGNQLLD